MPGQPVVTVLLAVHNDLRFLPAAVQSVLAQNFTAFELITIDDGSTDGCAPWLDAQADPRLHILRNSTNLGLTASLNRGLAEARGQYIARVDADDICHPNRLLRQVEFLDAHPNLGILGSSRELIDETGREIAVARATEGDLPIRWKCLLGNPFAHPTVMLRRSVLDEHALRYDESFRTAQDYELWTRLLQHAQGENLAEPLLRYRLRDGISRTPKPGQLANHDRISHAACQRLLPEFPLSPEEIHNLRGRYGGFSVREPDMGPADEKWVNLFRQMLNAFAAKHAQDANVDALVERETQRVRFP